MTVYKKLDGKKLSKMKKNDSFFDKFGTEWFVVSNDSKNQMLEVIDLPTGEIIKQHYQYILSGMYIPLLPREDF